LVAEWTRAHDTGAEESGQRPPLPNTGAAFLRLVDAGWDAEVAARPHAQHTTVVVHLDVKDQIARLHLGPLLCDADRRYLTCDATCEVWFERAGQPIGAGRATRLISRRLRRALEYRHPTCAVPGCGATRGCMPTTSGIGRTAASPSWTTWCCCALTIIGCTIGVSSPSPDPLRGCRSPTAPAER
jgi:hypothetical protein